MTSFKHTGPKSSLIALLLCFLTASSLQAQSLHSFVEYSTENGLSLNSVNDLHFDKQGFLWIATADGLQRFDGYRFQTFKHDALDKKGIAESSVSYVYEDTGGNLWITHRSGICYKPKGRNEFFELTQAIMGSVPVRVSLYCIGESDSLVWVMAYPRGIFTVNKRSLQVRKHSSFPVSFNTSIILPLSKKHSAQDKLWIRVSGDKTSDLYLASEKGITHYPNTRKIKIHFLIPQDKDSLMIVSDKLLYKALASDPFTPVKILSKKIDASDFHNEILTLPLKIANTQYLLPGDKNVWVYDENKEEISIFPHKEFFPGALIRYLNTSTADRHQNSWLGYNGIGGIKVLSLQKFNLFDRPQKNALTYTLTGDDNGNIYAGIYLGDIEMYTKDGQFIKKFILPETHKRFGSPRAMAMIDSVTLIVKSTLHELYGINIRTGAVQSLSNLLPQLSPASRVFELGIQKGNEGEIWYSYLNNIYTVRKEKKGFSSSVVCSLPASEVITSMYFKEGEPLWIGTISGVWKYENEKLTNIELPATYIKHINRNNDGSIWLATTNGVYILNNEKMVAHLSTKDDLPNSFVYSVLFDKAGNGWISTNRGIAKIRQVNEPGDTSYIVTSYSAREGLQGDEFNTKGYYKSSDGTLYFAGVNGINFFKPENLVSKSESSATMLTGIEVNNLPYKPELQPEFTNTITLSHRENNISLSFSCMDFTVPEKNQYKFWLKGFQNDWSLPQTNNTVQYILPVGNYELHVLGANYEGVWNKEPLIINISILPPWYQTSLARTIFALLILGTVAAAFYFISKNRYQRKLRVLQMEQQVQKEKQRLSRDLHDNLGSQITWLSNSISQIERAEQEHQPVEKKLTQLKEGTGELMQTLRETIWILNKDQISSVDLFDKVVNLASRHIEACPPMKLLTEENITLNTALNSGQALQIFRICQEAITNACKHAAATKLSIKADADEKHFSITISDNGKGFDSSSEKLSGHYGLQNMQERAKESSLQFQLQSSPGKGSSVFVSLAL